MTATDAPYFLTGHMAPVADEIDAPDLAVTGALPPELAGRYFRNGPNPRPGEVPPHWFFGHGMIHGIRIRGGRAEWYRNRWVRTGQFAGHPHFTDEGVDLAAGSANTLSAVREHGTNTVVVTGSAPLGATAAGREFLSVEDSTGYAVSVFRDALARHGVSVRGRTVTGVTPTGARTVATGAW